jgi:hypothetical protein
MEQVLPDRSSTLEQHLPQVVLDQYNRQFKPATYNAFRNAVQDAVPEREADFLLNCFIDACLEKCGARRYTGCTHTLHQHLGWLQDGTLLLELAEAHLAHFSRPVDLPLYVELDDFIEKLHHLATIASSLPGWRARAAFAWLYSAEYSLCAVKAVYVSRDMLSYVREKARLAAAHQDLAAYELDKADNE